VIRTGWRLHGCVPMPYGPGHSVPQPGRGDECRSGLRCRVGRFLLLVVVIIETLRQKGHSETLGIAGTADEEEERETHQQHQEHPRQNVEAGLGVAHRSPLREGNDSTLAMSRGNASLMA
jgi:hypothetical protein